MKRTTSNTSSTATSDIKIDAITIPDWNPRTADDELVASVQLHGILQPVGVVPDGDDGYRLIYGARRLDAARKAGRSTIPATVHDALDESGQRVACLVENAVRAASDPILEGKLFRELITLGLGVSEVARDVSKHPNYVRQRVRLAGLPTVTLRQLSQMDYSPAVAPLLAALPTAAQGHIIEALPHLLLSPEDLRDHLGRTCPPLSTAPFDTCDATLSPAPACAACKKRLDASDGDHCLDEACFTKKLSASICKSLVELRKGEPAAPLVATRAAYGPIEEEIYKNRAVTILKTERVAGDDEPGGRPAILLDDCRPRLVRLLPADRKPDGRASRYAAPDQRLEQQRTAFVARATVELLDKRLDTPTPPQLSDAGVFIRLLAAALLGSDFDSIPDAAHALLRALAPRLREKLSVRSIATVQPEPLRAAALRIHRLVACDLDADLSDLDAKAVQAFPG